MKRAFWENIAVQGWVKESVRLGSSVKNRELNRQTRQVEAFASSRRTDKENTVIRIADQAKSTKLVISNYIKFLVAFESRKVRINSGRLINFPIYFEIFQK